MFARLSSVFLLSTLLIGCATPTSFTHQLPKKSSQVQRVTHKLKALKARKKATVRTFKVSDRDVQFIAADAVSRMKSYRHKRDAIDLGFKTLEDLQNKLGEDHIVVLGGAGAAFEVIDDERSTYLVLLRTLDRLRAGAKLSNRQIFTYGLEVMNGTINDTMVGLAIMGSIGAFHKDPKVVSAIEKILSGFDSAPSDAARKKLLQDGFKHLRRTFR